MGASVERGLRHPSVDRRSSNDGLEMSVRRPRPGRRFSESELNARLRFVIGVTLAATLCASVLCVLYFLGFVSQPLEQSPNDAELFRILGPTISFLTGTLSGVMIGTSARRGDKDGDGVPDEEEEKAA